jgi:hypothetical protein
MLSRIEGEQVTKALHALGTPSGRELADWFRHLAILDYMDCLSATMLLAPRFEELNIRATEGWCRYPWLRAMRRNIGLYPKLSKITIHDAKIRAADVASILTFPSLQRLVLTVPIEAEDPYSSERNSSPVPPSLDHSLANRLDGANSSIQHLHISGTYEVITKLLKMIETCPRLRSLRIEFNERDEYDEHQWDAYIMLIDLLDDHCPRLDDLQIRDTSPLDKSLITEISTSLRELKQLQTLEIDFKILIPIIDEDPEDVLGALEDIICKLPKGLQNLALAFEDCEEVIKASSAPLRNLIPRIPTLLPTLRKFTVVDCNPLTDAVICQDDLAVLQVAFKEVGVEFVSRAQAIDPACGSQLDCLEYVEPGWVWVRPMVWYGEQLKWSYHMLQSKAIGQCGIDDSREVDCELNPPADRSECSDDSYDSDTHGPNQNWDSREEPWVGKPWVFVEISGEKDDVFMEQHKAEQPVWYWEELRQKSRARNLEDGNGLACRRVE